MLYNICPYLRHGVGIIGIVYYGRCEIEPRPGKHSPLPTQMMRIVLSYMHPPTKMKIISAPITTMTSLQEWTNKTKKTQTTITVIQNKIVTRT